MNGDEELEHLPNAFQEKEEKEQAVAEQEQADIVA
jgi:hypothetical protein